MLIPKNLILEAKEKLGADSALIIAKDLKIKEFDEKNLKGLCCFHEENTPSLIWNHKDNSFKCFGCGRVYGIIDHYIEYNGLTFLDAVEKLFDQTNIEFSFGRKGVRTQRDYKYPQYTPDKDRNLVEKYFDSRKISKKTLDYCDVQQCNGLVYWNFYNENDVLLTVKCRHPRKHKKTEKKEWHLPNFSNTPILFNMNKIDPTQTLIITEGQIDCLTVIEAGFKNVVSIPCGTANLKWIEENFEWLESFNKIILWFDNDSAGINARIKTSSRLGIYRTLFVDLPLELKKGEINQRVKDANAVIYHVDKNRVADFILGAKEVPIANVKNLAEITEYDIETAPGIYTGIKQLDKIVYKFLFGNVLLITGKSGSGKSALTNQLFVSEVLEQGYDVFYYSGEIHGRILKSWININIAGTEKVKMKSEFVRVIDSNANKLINEWYNNRVWVYSEKDSNYKKILDAIINVVRKYGVQVIILDNLMSIDLDASGNDTLQKEKNFIIKLGEISELYNVFIALVAHPRKTVVGQQDLGLDDVYGAVQLTQASDYAMAVKRFSEKEKSGFGKGKQRQEPIDHDARVDIIKNRFTGKQGHVLLHFHYPTYRFYNNVGELHKRYKWNKDGSPLKTNDPKKEIGPHWLKDNRKI